MVCSQVMTNAAADQAAKLVTAGVPADHVTTTGEEVHIVFTPDQAHRFAIVLGVLEETAPVCDVLHEVWV